MSAERRPTPPAIHVETHHLIDGHRAILLTHEDYTQQVGVTNLDREVSLAEVIIRQGKEHYSQQLKGHYELPELQEGETIFTIGMLGHEKTQKIIAKRLGKEPHEVGWDAHKDVYRGVLGVLDAVRKPREPRRQ